ncbi:hypothetical protein DAMA08_049220 [Martiniozyma asiatica (nom. inval.)]|nr:hypothetical protein DAMA08_049220 [Martiniozyma asiatica]
MLRTKKYAPLWCSRSLERRNYSKAVDILNSHKLKIKPKFKSFPQSSTRYDARVVNRVKENPKYILTLHAKKKIKLLAVISNIERGSSFDTFSHNIWELKNLKTDADAAGKRQIELILEQSLNERYKLITDPAIICMELFKFAKMGISLNSIESLNTGSMRQFLSLNNLSNSKSIQFLIGSYTDEYPILNEWHNIEIRSPFVQKYPIEILTMLYLNTVCPICDTHLKKEFEIIIRHKIKEADGSKYMSQFQNLFSLGDFITNGIPAKFTGHEDNQTILANTNYHCGQFAKETILKMLFNNNFAIFTSEKLLLLANEVCSTETNALSTLGQPNLESSDLLNGDTILKDSLEQFKAIGKLYSNIDVKNKALSSKILNFIKRWDKLYAGFKMADDEAVTRLLSSQDKAIKLKIVKDLLVNRYILDYSEIFKGLETNDKDQIFFLLTAGGYYKHVSKESDVIERISKLYSPDTYEILLGRYAPYVSGDLKRMLKLAFPNSTKNGPILSAIIFNPRKDTILNEEFLRFYEQNNINKKNDNLKITVYQSLIYSLLNESTSIYEIFLLTCAIFPRLSPVATALYQSPIQLTDGAQMEKKLPSSNLLCKLFVQIYQDNKSIVSSLIEFLQTPFATQDAEIKHIINIILKDIAEQFGDITALKYIINEKSNKITISNLAEILKGKSSVSVLEFQRFLKLLTSDKINVQLDSEILNEIVNCLEKKKLFLFLKYLPNIVSYIPYVEKLSQFLSPLEDTKHVYTKINKGVRFDHRLKIFGFSGNNNNSNNNNNNNNNSNHQIPKKLDHWDVSYLYFVFWKNVKSSPAAETFLKIMESSLIKSTKPTLSDSINFLKLSILFNKSFKVKSLKKLSPNDLLNELISETSLFLMDTTTSKKIAPETNFLLLLKYIALHRSTNYTLADFKGYMELFYVILGSKRHFLANYGFFDILSPERQNFLETIVAPEAFNESIELPDGYRNILISVLRGSSIKELPEDILPFFKNICLKLTDDSNINFEDKKFPIGLNYELFDKMSDILFRYHRRIIEKYPHFFVPVNLAFSIIKVTSLSKPSDLELVLNQMWKTLPHTELHKSVENVLKYLVENDQTVAEDLFLVYSSIAVMFRSETAVKMGWGKTKYRNVKNVIKYDNFGCDVKGEIDTKVGGRKIKLFDNMLDQEAK